MGWGSYSHPIFSIGSLYTTATDLLFKPNTYGYKKNFWKENLVEKSIFKERTLPEEPRAYYSHNRLKEAVE